MQIEAVEVVRDENGHWTHPALPESDDEHIPLSWFADHGLEVKVVQFEDDASQELVDAYYDNGEPDCSAWQPSAPAGEGWFIFSIHDTEGGPICAWVRRIAN